MNKKIITFAILGIFLLAGTFAFVFLENGDISLGENELAQLTNQQIANYMENNLQITNYKSIPSKIIVYYNITYLEPTHTNNSYRVFTQEKPFIIEKQFWDFCINKTSKSTCKNYLVDRDEPYYLIENNSYEKEVTEYNNVSKERIVTLYNETEIFNETTNETTYESIPYNITETYYELEPYQVNRTFYEIKNTTITSTKYQATQEQIKQYDRAIEFRDKAIENSLDDLEGEF